MHCSGDAGVCMDLINKLWLFFSAVIGKITRGAAGGLIKFENGPFVTRQRVSVIFGVICLVYSLVLRDRRGN